MSTIPIHECPEADCDTWFLTANGLNGHKSKHERQEREEIAQSDVGRDLFETYPKE